MNFKKDGNFYMANLGAEMKRALRFFEKKMYAEYRGARDRVEQIVLQFLATGPSPGGKEEALLLRDLVRHMHEGRQALSQSMLSQHFAPFAYRALATAEITPQA
jgi:hypothetical protein